MPDSSVRPFRLGAIILAAGGSSRMGSPKQLIRISGVSLVARAAGAALGAGANPVVVVVGSDSERVRSEVACLPVLTAVNPDWATGLASSIRAGIAALAAAAPSLDAVVVAPCDQPALSPEVILRLTDLHRSSRLIAASHYSGRNGAPAVFGREHFAELAGLTGDEGARRILNAGLHGVASVELPALANDLDTPDDYAAWLSSER